MHAAGHIPFLPCLPPWLPKQNITSAWLWGHLPCSHQAGKNIPRTWELPENQRPPALSRRLLAWHPSAVATCDVVLCVCSHRDSCQRGWRLLYIVTAYHSCSEVLQPHLVHYLHNVSQTPGLPFQGEEPTISGDPGPRACLYEYWLGSQWEGRSGGPGPSQMPRQCLLRLTHSPNICGGPAGADALGCLI